MTRFQHRYRIESTRLKGWDYTAGWYFVTICTHQRRCFFGEVSDDIVCLSPIGRIVAEEWERTAIVRPYVWLDGWVLMPDHFHGIIAIDDVETAQRDDVETAQRDDVETAQCDDVETAQRDDVETARRVVSTLRARSLGAIIGQFKSVATKRIWAAGWRDFAWQTRFHDRIIRDQAGLDAVRRYIANNPRRWMGLR